jgi:hypothetical protein
MIQTMAMISGVVLAYHRLSPAPTVRTVPQPSGGAILTFGNVGVGPMYVKQLYLEINGERVPVKTLHKKLNEMREFPTYQVQVTGSDLLGTYRESQLYTLGSQEFSSIITMRPKKNQRSLAVPCIVDFVEDLRLQQLVLVAEVLPSDMSPLNHRYFLRTIRIPIPIDSIIPESEQKHHKTTKV